MKLASPSLKTGVPCSACGAMVLVRPGLRWTKMQCPKCRAVTALPSPGMAEPLLEAGPRSELADGPPPKRPDAAQFEARISILEARLVSLEQELASLRTLRDEEPVRDRQPEGCPEAPKQSQCPEVADDANRNEAQPERNGKPDAEHQKEARLDQPPGASHWTTVQMAQAGRVSCDPSEQELPRVKANGKHSGITELQIADEAGVTPGSSGASAVLEPAQAQEEEQLKAASADRMVEKLAEMAAGKIAIRVKEGDTEAILFGEWLGLLFIKAGWTVATFEARPIPPEEQNLTLAISGNFPFPKRASTIHAALSAAGLGLDFGIDPASTSPIPTIIVPRRPVKENGHVIEDAPRASRERESRGDLATNGSGASGS